MRVKCPYCQTKAIVTHHHKLSDKASSIYITCTSHECGARSVMRLSHAGTITPPLATQTDALHEWFANLPEAEQKSIAKLHQPSIL